MQSLTQARFLDMAPFEQLALKIKLHTTHVYMTYIGLLIAKSANIIKIPHQIKSLVELQQSFSIDNKIVISFFFLIRFSRLSKTARTRVN